MKRLVGRIGFGICAITEVFMEISMESFDNYNLFIVAGLLLSFSLELLRDCLSLPFSDRSSFKYFQADGKS